MVETVEANEGRTIQASDGRFALMAKLVTHNDERGHESEGTEIPRLRSARASADSGRERIPGGNWTVDLLGIKQSRQRFDLWVEALRLPRSAGRSARAGRASAAHASRLCSRGRNRLQRRRRALAVRPPAALGRTFPPTTTSMRPSFRASTSARKLPPLRSRPGGRRDSESHRRPAFRPVRPARGA
jgi:hypothetical protein